MEGRPIQGEQDVQVGAAARKQAGTDHQEPFISTPGFSKFLPVLTANVNRCCFVIVETLLIQLGCFWILLKWYENIKILNLLCIRPHGYLCIEKYTFIFSSMAPQSLLRALLGCFRAWLTPRRISPILMDIWATPARHTSSCSCNYKVNT